MFQRGHCWSKDAFGMPGKASDGLKRPISLSQEWVSRRRFASELYQCLAFWRWWRRRISGGNIERILFRWKRDLGNSWLLPGRSKLRLRNQWQWSWAEFRRWKCYYWPKWRSFAVILFVEAHFDVSSLKLITCSHESRNISSETRRVWRNSPRLGNMICYRVVLRISVYGVIWVVVDCDDLMDYLQVA